MLLKMKYPAMAIAFAGIVFTASISSRFSLAFGKHYQGEKDFSCCKNHELIIHHYYTVQLFWIEVAEGYTEESTGKQTPDQCLIICNN